MPSPRPCAQLLLRPLAVLLTALLLSASTLIGGGPARADAVPAAGAELFAQHCSGCHIHGGNIIRRNRTLKLEALRQRGLAGPEAIAAVAASGIGQMGGYGAVLGAGGAEAVANYVWQEAQAGWPRR